jgi:hypothetical protein
MILKFIEIQKTFMDVRSFSHEFVFCVQTGPFFQIHDKLMAQNSWGIHGLVCALGVQIITHIA